MSAATAARREDTVAPLLPSVDVAGPLPLMAWLALDDLGIDERYQRDATSRCSAMLIKRIADGWDWRRYQPVTVARIHVAGWARYAVIDGQHRLLAARRRSDIESLPCYVVGAAEVEVQAAAFRGVNRDRVRLTPLALHQAALIAGDAAAEMVERVVAKAGAIIPERSKSSRDLKPRELMAVGQIYRVVGALGEDVATRGLKICVDAYRDVGGELQAALIGAVCAFIAAYGVEDAALTGILADAPADQWRERGRDWVRSRGGSMRNGLIRVLQAAYNKRRMRRLASS